MAQLLTLVLLLPTTWIVDQSNGPGTNFIDLPPAVAAAASGDTIIVRPGAYTPFNVSGKALTILGAGPASTTVSMGLPAGAPWAETRVQGVPAGATFYISGVRFAPVNFPSFSTAWSAAGLQVLASAGAVVLSGVEVFGATFVSGSPGNPGLVVNGAEVHATRCTFSGGSGSYAPAGTATVVTGVIVADASTFQGGSGTTQYAAGGSGLSLLGGVASLTRSSAAGATGGMGAGAGVSVAAGAFLRAAGTSADSFHGGTILIMPGMTYGMPAVAVASGGSAVLHGNITLVPGPTASPTTGAVTIGAPLPYLSIAGTSTAGGDLSATQPVTVTLDGVIPSAPYALVVDVAPGFTTAYAPMVLGELVVPLPPASLFEGVLGASGTLQLMTTPAVFAPAIVGVPLYLQLGVLDSAAGNIRVSNGQIRRFQ